MLNISTHIKNLLLATLLLVPVSFAQAAFLDVSNLSVDTVSANISASDILGNEVVNTGSTLSLIPPADIMMGIFQPSIFTFTTTFTDGSFTGNVYSEAAPGISAPSSTVDTVAENFSSVDLSSLRLSGLFELGSPPLSTELSFDTELWPLTTDPTSSFYDPISGEFSLTWAITEMVEFTDAFSNTQAYSTSVDLTISGIATVVPVPAALWLFMSGILGLAGFIRHKK